MVSFDNRLRHRLGISRPLVQAPMAGVASPELVAAVCRSGGLGSLGVGYMAPDAIREAIRAVRRRTDRPFAVNLFVPGPEPASGAPEALREVLDPLYAELGMPPPKTAPAPPPAFAEQARVVLREGVPVVSFTFGVPEAEWLRTFHEQGRVLVGTATSADEAAALEQAGVDAVVVQGAEAGGHRGGFLPASDDPPRPLSPLLMEAGARVRLPLIAAGAIMTPADVREMLESGAAAVQCGTAFIPCRESAAAAAYKDAVLAGRGEQTTITPVISGRPARGLRNRLIEVLERRADALPGFPRMNGLTAPLRREAGRLGRADLMSLWAGTGCHLARRLPAADLVENLTGDL
ncbi:MAG TPA: nitronate monooxygenase [Gammaproteobacteria bacterium]|nr:nitronate monooxygenase [Gammaproteobacteria bacterium]